MADDEDGPLPDPNPPGQATPNRGLRRAPPLLDATARPAEPAAAEPGEAGHREPAGMDVMADHPELREAFTPTDEPAAAPEAAATSDDAESNDDQPPGRRALVPLLLFGLGLVIAALLAAVLFRQFNPPVDEAATAQAARFDVLQQRVAALEAKPAPVADTGPLTDRLGALERTAGDFKAQLDDLQAKLVAQATVAATAAPPPPPPRLPVDLAPLQARIADLENGSKALRDQVAALPKPDDRVPKQVADLGQGLAAVRAAVASEQAAVAALPRVDLAPVDRKVADLGTALSGLQAAVAGLPRVDLGPLDARLEALQHRIEPVEAALAAPKDGARATEARQNGSAAEAHAAPLAVAAQAVVQALDEGQPYGSALAALQGLGADPRGARGGLRPGQGRDAGRRSARAGRVRARPDGGGSTRAREGARNRNESRAGPGCRGVAHRGGAAKRRLGGRARRMAGTAGRRQGGVATLGRPAQGTGGRRRRGPRDRVGRHSSLGATPMSAARASGPATAAGGRMGQP